MAGFFECCVFGLLVLTCIAAEKVPPESARTKCKSITLRSTSQTVDRELIKDDRGKPADIISMTVVKKLSTTKCELDDTFLISEPHVIARKGCAAEFKVCYRSDNSPEPTVSDGCKLVRLLSRLNRDTEETLDERIVSMRVVRRLSESVKCESRKNYGFTGKIAYARDGCRADFEVCLSETRSSDTKVCESVTLRSSLRVADEKRILDTNGKPVAVVSMDLVSQLSTVKCMEWKTFSFNESFVVARLGCQGKFRVCYIKSVLREDEGCITVRLLSTLHNSARKKVAHNPDEITSITVQEQYSGIRCVRNKNFGIKGTDVYSSGGCRAEFLVCLEDSKPTTKPTQNTCVNVLLASWGPHEPDWKKITGRDGRRVTINDIRLLRRDSKEDCVEGKTFFVKDRDEVHAIKGCRGVIRVCYA